MKNSLTPFQNVNLYTRHGVYRAHVTNTGHHLTHNLYDTTVYGNNRLWPSLSAKPQWDRQRQYLADVYHFNGAELLFTHGTITNTHTKDPIYDCPPPNATGYRYVAYTQLHIRRTFDINYRGFLLETRASAIHTLPAPAISPASPNTRLTIDDALFIYYTYQYNDILRSHEQLRNTLLSPLLPTNADIIATMDNAIRDQANDGCGIYTCNDTEQ